MSKSKPLTDTVIRHAKPGVNHRKERTDEPYKLGDTGGLHLEVQPGGAKWWRWKYRYEGRQKCLVLTTLAAGAPAPVAANPPPRTTTRTPARSTANSPS
jgi:hypothetical protein